ncbi:MAG: hypothetical protein WC998_00780 [Candidatus Paceibacterota bacterium]|jgi:hypothetical protein
MPEFDEFYSSMTEEEREKVRGELKSKFATIVLLVTNLKQVLQEVELVLTSDSVITELVNSLIRPKIIMKAKDNIGDVTIGQCSTREVRIKIQPFEGQIGQVIDETAGRFTVRLGNADVVFDIDEIEYVK